MEPDHTDYFMILIVGLSIGVVGGLIVIAIAKEISQWFKNLKSLYDRVKALEDKIK